MSDREKRGLRGPVKSCTEVSTHSSWTDSEGKMHPEFQSQYTTEYDAEGRLSTTGFGNSNGSTWMTYFTYDASGRLLKTTSGIDDTDEQPKGDFISLRSRRPAPEHTG